MSIKTVNDIPSISVLYKAGNLKPSSSSSKNPTTTSGEEFKYSKDLNDRICLIRTDITTLEVGAIVNAANNTLLGGGGVDGAIHRKAGRELYEECYNLDGCETGDAKMTRAYRLPCDRVLHAVGPVYFSTKPKGTHSKLLSSCYKRCLQLAVEAQLESIAFSCISTGVYGYPSMDAAVVACQTVRKFLEEEKGAGVLKKVIFCSFEMKDEIAYGKVVPVVFPPAPPPTPTPTKEACGEGERKEEDGKAEGGGVKIPTDGEEDSKEDVKKQQQQQQQQPAQEEAEVTKDTDAPAIDQDKTATTTAGNVATPSSASKASHYKEGGLSDDDWEEISKEEAVEK